MSVCSDDCDSFGLTHMSAGVISTTWISYTILASACICPLGKQQGLADLIPRVLILNYTVTGDIMDRLNVRISVPA